MRPRTSMLALMLIACCPVTWAADPAAAEVAPMTAQLRTESRAEPAPLDRQVADLQRQVAALQAQVNALLSAVKVTETGVVLQGPAVTIQGGKIDMTADAALTVRANDLTADMMRNTSFRSGASLSVSSGTSTVVHSAGTMDIKGVVIKFNNGTKPVATAGSAVQTPAGAGQVMSGSPTLFTN